MYKIICINLKRRPDRKEAVVAQLERNNIINYEFFEAIDGTDSILEIIQPVQYFKNSIRLSQGALGCAISHYNIWKKLSMDPQCDFYLVLEDDIKLCSNFKENLDHLLNGFNLITMPILLIGMHIPLNRYASTRDTYALDNTYTIHPLNRSLYAGGAFGYIITKWAVHKLMGHIQTDGVKMAIDWLMFRCGPPIYESHPHLVFSDAVQESDHYVDSDIQHNQIAFNFKLIVNNYIFEDYVFFPNKDSNRGDIKEIYADILTLKKMADNMENCVAFNTYGWLKHTVVPIKEFNNLANKFYTIDGIYVKKASLFN